MIARVSGTRSRTSSRYIVPDARGLGGVDVQHDTGCAGRVGHRPVPERRTGADEPAGQHPPVGAVDRAFAQPFAFELGERAEQPQHHPPGRGLRVDHVGGGDHPQPERVEVLDQAEQVQQAATQPVQLGDQHHLDLARRGRGEHLLQRRARRRSPGHAGIQVLADQDQTMRAGQGLALLALRVDRGRVHLGAGRNPQIAHRARQASTSAPARTARHTHDTHPRMPAAPMPTPGFEVRPIIERLCRPWSSPTATTEWLHERCSSGSPVYSVVAPRAGWAPLRSPRLLWRGHRRRCYRRLGRLSVIAAWCCGQDTPPVAAPTG